jgi:hypothetical protein
MEAGTPTTPPRPGSACTGARAAYPLVSHPRSVIGHAIHGLSAGAMQALLSRR